MHPVPPLAQQWPRGPTNELHGAAFNGSSEGLVALLSNHSVDIDQGDPKGCTPLMIAAYHGNSDAVMILLVNGADVSIVEDYGRSALHASAQEGYCAISKMLLNAGADLEVTALFGITPLAMAAQQGHTAVMRVLLEAGANPDSRRSDGNTPLLFAAQHGDVDAIRMLLGAQADPLLSIKHGSEEYLPLDVAAQFGHSEVVRELVQHDGINGCGGASGGAKALRLAAKNQHVDILTLLTDAGVVDDGMSLAFAAAFGRELSAKFLLRQRKDDEAAYVNAESTLEIAPLFLAIGVAGFFPSPRTVRILVDAGADTTSAVRFTNNESVVGFEETPLALTTRMIREKRVARKEATEEQLHQLEGIRRLLLQVEAVHAISLLWPVVIPSMIGTAEAASRTLATPTALRTLLPILRRRAGRPRVVLAALVRCDKIV